MNSRLIGAMQEATQGITIVKAFTMEDELSRQARGADRRMPSTRPTRSRASPSGCRRSPKCWPASPLPASSPMPASARSYGSQPPGAVFSFITALLLAYDPARRLARSQVRLERSLVNARMIYEILDLEPQQGDAPGAPSRSRSASGEVRFDHVSFAYHRGYAGAATMSASSPRPARPPRSSAAPAPARRR